MTLKAAYFAALGFNDNQDITMGDLQEAVKFGKTAFVSWPKFGQLHSVRAWAETLVIRRGLGTGTAYDLPGFGNKVASQGRRLEGYWSET